MAHCIYLDDDEISMLRKYSTKVAHCPSSNFFLKSGIFNATRITDAGLDVGLGSDVGGGPNLSLYVKRDVQRLLHVESKLHIV